MFNIEFRNSVWSYSYLQTDSRFTEDERHEIAIRMIEMYESDKFRMKIKGKRYEGIVRMTKPCVILGSIVGRQYEAKIETDFGKSELCVIMNSNTSIDRPGSN